MEIDSIQSHLLKLQKKKITLLSILETKNIQILTIMMINDESSLLLNMDLSMSVKVGTLHTPTLEQTTLEKCKKLILVTRKVRFCTPKQRFS